MIFFSASTMGFYDTAIHSIEEIPSDAKEITNEDRLRLVKGQISAILVADENGYPALQDPH